METLTCCPECRLGCDSCSCSTVSAQGCDCDCENPSNKVNMTVLLNETAILTVSVNATDLTEESRSCVNETWLYLHLVHSHLVHNWGSVGEEEVHALLS